MYKCGYQGCEKAYGTLNHLNAHVTMQSHGPKRTPEGTSFVKLRRSRQVDRVASWRGAIARNPLVYTRMDVPCPA